MPQLFVQPICGRGPCNVIELPTKRTRGPVFVSSNYIWSFAF